MPELPEVETTKRGLAPHLVGHTIAHIGIHAPKLRWPIPRQLTKLLPGARIRSIERRGKYLLFDCEVGYLLLHLGMSGSLRVVPSATARGAYDHFEMVLDNGQALRLRDPRRFGAVLWAGPTPMEHPLLQTLGVEPMTPAFTADYLYQHTRSRTAAIKQVIMDSHLVVGVGNIYASEALFGAGIRPQTPANKLSRPRCTKLVTAINATLTRAIESGGSTLRDFLRVDGEPGYFQLESFVYGRAGEPCRHCGQPIRQIKQGQRSTFYCAVCQK